MKCIIHINKEVDEEDVFRAYVTIIIGNFLEVCNIVILENNNQLAIMLPRYISEELDEEGLVMYKEAIEFKSYKNKMKLFLEIINAYQSIHENSGTKSVVIDLFKCVKDFKIELGDIQCKGGIRKCIGSVNLVNCFTINNIEIIEKSGVISINMPTYRISTNNNHNVITKNIFCFIDKNFEKKLYNQISKCYFFGKK